MDATFWMLALANAAALVWGAATLRSELQHLREIVVELKEQFRLTSQTLQATLTDHGTRLAVLEEQARDRA